MAGLFAKRLARAGRGGDSELAHVSPDEAVVPERVLDRGDTRSQLKEGFDEAGLPMDRFIVGGGEGSASPEDTATYEEFLGNVLNIVYDEKVASGMAPSFQGPSPVESLALFVSGAVARVAYSGLENGQNITREMAVAATAQISEDIGTEMAQAVGAQPLNDEQIQAVFLRSVELLADQRDDRQMTDEAGKGMMPPQGGQEAPQGPGGPPVPGMA